MKTILKSSCLIGFVLLHGPLVLAQTDGAARFRCTINDYNGSSQKHYTVGWVTTAGGTFITSLRKQGPSSWTSSQWRDHCGVWNTARAGSTNLDGYTSATAQDYTGTNSPVIWTWNCRDANNNLVPDGTYKFWVQYAEDSGQGPYTTNGLIWVKGPTPLTTNYPNLSPHFTSLSTTWTPVAPPAPPYIASVRLEGGNLVLSGTGSVNRAYYVLSATNAGQAPATWARVATNAFDGQGRFSFTTPLGASPQKFYRLQSY
jgi:hypothetical protein